MRVPPARTSSRPSRSLSSGMDPPPGFSGPLRKIGRRRLNSHDSIPMISSVLVLTQGRLAIFWRNAVVCTSVLSQLRAAADFVFESCMFSCCTLYYSAVCCGGRLAWASGGPAFGTTCPQSRGSCCVVLARARKTAKKSIA
jgi:hypothetical protein